MLKLLVTVGGDETDYTKFVDWSTLNIQEQINLPSQATFVIRGYGQAFVMPPQRAYIRVYSTKYQRSLFTGFVASEPVKSFLGLAAAAPPGTNSQLLEYAYTCTSDEYLLNIKSVPFMNAFVNQTQGQIIKSLVAALCPGFFDTSQVEDGDLVPYYSYDPSKSFSEIVKALADPSRYRYKVRDRQIFYTPYGDNLLGISYDESMTADMFEPRGLKTTVLATPIVNDVTVIGDVEAGNNREDYFIGDGFTTNFPLLHKVFRGSSTLLLQDDWTENSLNTQNWYLQDPAAQFDFSAGALNVVSGFEFPLGQSYLTAVNGVELAGGIDLEHGEIAFNDVCFGIVGGLYTDAALSASGFLCGFNVSSPTGVVTSASGAQGVLFQALWGSSGVGPVFSSRINHSYILQTVVSAPQYTRWRQTYRTVAGEEYGGAEVGIKGSVTFIVQDTDIALATGFFYQPQVTKTTVNNVDLPAFCQYALLNNQQLNLALNYTTIASMMQGALCCDIGPSGLFVPTGLILPMLPPGSGGYNGAVTPWPDAASGNIYLPPGDLVGWAQEVLGNGFENQAAQVTAGNSADQLSFYAQTCPAAGTPVRFQSFEAQAAVSRLQSSGSIEAEKYVVGDDGIRASIISNLQPLPRTSEDCDNAALAYLEDHTGVFYNGSYICTSNFLKPLTSDVQFWPTVGRFLYVNCPSRGINKQNMIVTSLQMAILDAVTEVLTFSLTFGADMYLEKVLFNFVDLAPSSVLTPTDKANPPNPRYTVNVDNSLLQDLSNVQAVKITDEEVIVCVFDEYTGQIEIRLTDANFGMGPDAFGWVGTVFVVGGPSGVYAPITTEDNAALLLKNLNNSNSITYQGGPDQYNPIGYDSSVIGTSMQPLPSGYMVPALRTPNPGPNPSPSGGILPLNGFRLPRTQFDQAWYMRPVSISGGITSRRSKVIRVRYPQKPQPPTIISVTSNFIQFDFNGDIRSIYGFELRAADNETILVQKPVASYADLNIDLTQTGNSFYLPLPINGTEPGQANRKFYAYFFNHQWSYSDSSYVEVAIPQAPVIELGYRFGQSLDIMCDLDPRIDIASQVFEVWNSSGYFYTPIRIPYYVPPGSANFITRSQFNYEAQNWTANVPLTGDLFVRSYRSDLISSGDYSNWLRVPQGDIIASDYLSGQGSVPPTLSNSSGALMSYTSSVDSIYVQILPFELLFPNGQLVPYGEATGYYTETIDTASGLQPSSGYLFYFSAESPAFEPPDILIDGPYQMSSTGALFNQTADGRLPLANGGLEAYCASPGVTYVSAVVVLDGGSWPYDTHVAYYDLIFSGGGGSGAAGKAAVVFGTIKGCTVTAGGSGYTSAPSVSVSGPGTDYDLVAFLGSAGGSGGGTFGGGACGVLGSKVTLDNGVDVSLEDVKVGSAIRGGAGPEKLISKHTIPNQEVWTVVTESGKRTRVGLAHTFRTRDGYTTLCELLADMKCGDVLPQLRTVDGYETIASIEDGGMESVCHLHLEGPTHLYLLDGFWNHNIIYKSG